MPKVVWTDKCLQRIEEISDYIELDSKKNAEQFIKEIFDKEEMLKNNPKIGKIVPDYEIEEYRQIIIRNYRLVYKINGKSLNMITIRHCRQEKIMNE